MDSSASASPICAFVILCFSLLELIHGSVSTFGFMMIFCPPDKGIWTGSTWTWLILIVAFSWILILLFAFFQRLFFSKEFTDLSRKKGIDLPLMLHDGEASFKAKIIQRGSRFSLRPLPTRSVCRDIKSPLRLKQTFKHMCAFESMGCAVCLVWVVLCYIQWQ